MSHHAPTSNAGTRDPSNMGHMLRHDDGPIHHQRGLSVDVRLAALLGVKPVTAHSLLYGERSILNRALSIVAAFRETGRDARQHFAPLMAALAEPQSVSIARLMESNAREQSALAQYLESGRAQVRRALIVALECGAAVRMALATFLRSEDTGVS